MCPKCKSLLWHKEKKTKVDDGSLVRVTYTAGDKSAEVEMPKEAYKKLYDYLKANPNGALKLIEDEGKKSTTHG